MAGRIQAGVLPAAVVVAALLESGCGSHPTAAAKPAVRLFVPPAPVPSPAPPVIDEPPLVEPAAAEAPAWIIPLELELPPPPRVRRRTRVAAAPRAAGEPEATIEEDDPPSPAADLPKLGQLMEPAQQETLSREIEQMLNRAVQAVGTLNRRRLTLQQKANLQRVSVFIEQARETRAKDLMSARALAERADLLARDLLRITQ